MIVDDIASRALRRPKTSRRLDETLVPQHTATCRHVKHAAHDREINNIRPVAVEPRQLRDAQHALGDEGEAALGGHLEEVAVKRLLEDRQRKARAAQPGRPLALGLFFSAGGAWL